MLFIDRLSTDVCNFLVRNRFAIFSINYTAIPFIKVLKSILHPGNKFRIGRRIFFVCNMGIRGSCRLVGSGLSMPHSVMLMKIGL